MFYCLLYDIFIQMIQIDQRLVQSLQNTDGLPPIRQEQIQLFPYQAIVLICVIVTEGNYVKSIGTGFLIDSQTIVTAAHNVQIMKGSLNCVCYLKELKEQRSFSRSQKSYKIDTQSVFIPQKYRSKNKQNGSGSSNGSLRRQSWSNQAGQSNQSNQLNPSGQSNRMNEPFDSSNIINANLPKDKKVNTQFDYDYAFVKVEPIQLKKYAQLYTRDASFINRFLGQNKKASLNISGFPRYSPIQRGGKIKRLIEYSIPGLQQFNPQLFFFQYQLESQRGYSGCPIWIYIDQDNPQMTQMKVIGIVVATKDKVIIRGKQYKVTIIRRVDATMSKQYQSWKNKKGIKRQDPIIQPFNNSGNHSQQPAQAPIKIQAQILQNQPQNHKPNDNNENAPSPAQIIQPESQNPEQNHHEQVKLQHNQIIPLVNSQNNEENTISTLYVFTKLIKAKSMIILPKDSNFKLINHFQRYGTRSKILLILKKINKQIINTKEKNNILEKIIFKSDSRIKKGSIKQIKYDRKDPIPKILKKLNSKYFIPQDSKITIKVQLNRQEESMNASPNVIKQDEPIENIRGKTLSFQIEQSIASAQKINYLIFLEQEKENQEWRFEVKLLSSRDKIACELQYI